MKERARIVINETEDGYQVDIKGKDLKGLFSCCCCGPDSQESECCSDGGDKTEKK